MSKIAYYAARIARIPGIYTKWEDCAAQVIGYSGAIYKKFSSREDAANFLSDDQKATVPVAESCNKIASVITSSVSINNPVVCNTTYYTDGSYSTKIKRSGFAAVDAKNKQVYCQSIDGGTNNVAELNGIKLAILLAKQDKCEEFEICCDSMYAITAVQKKCKIIANIDLVNEIAKMAADFKITFTHVSAHKGIEFNELADKYAKHAAENKLETVTKYTV